MTLTWLKAVHIVFIVSWFAALFYIVRLFIYTAEAQQRDEAARKVLTAQLLLMQRRLWNIIGWPAMAGTVITGTWMLALNFDYYFSQGWMQLKLVSVLVLLWYHFACQRILNRQGKGIFTWTSIRLRLFNELATVLLVAIVFLVVLKSTSGLVYGVGGLLLFGLLLTGAVFLYRRARKTE
jgi:protoporphyrinogen IX oxidase